MAHPASKSGLKEYCLRQLGAPVLEINLAEEQCEDLIDDALQLFQERHFDGVLETYLKYKVTQEDVDRGTATTRDGSNNWAGITTTTATAPASSGISTTGVQFDFEENSNYLQIPPAVIGVNRIFRYDGSQTTTNNMFSIKYQLFLNDVYTWGAMEMLTYSMTKTYLSDLDFMLNTEKQIRFNQRMDRLYLDIDWQDVSPSDYFIIDCWRILDPSDYARVWNDSFLKRYTTQLFKRQWGQNLIKFQGVKLPGGVELNGRQIYDDAQKELERIGDQMMSTYELPPLDLIA